MTCLGQGMILRVMQLGAGLVHTNLHVDSLLAAIAVPYWRIEPTLSLGIGAVSKRSHTSLNLGNVLLSHRYISSFALSKILDRLRDASPGSGVTGIVIFYPVRRGTTRGLHEYQS